MNYGIFLQGIEVHSVNKIPRLLALLLKDIEKFEIYKYMLHRNSLIQCP